jgi:DNA helicase-2/ATP-dependent DNA helicase PcrA
MEEALRRVNIKYKIVGGLSFYQRREIKDLIAYLRLTINHNDEESFKRIVNLPKRGIGPGTINKILVGAEDHGISLWKVLENITQFVHGKVAVTLQNFVTMIKRFELEVNRKNAFEAATIIAKESGILKELYDDKTIEGLNRYENVQELLNAVKEFVDNPENETTGLSEFLQEVALLTGVDQDNDEDRDKVTLMTIHMAKGLEFEHVYIVGLEEDLFPSQMMLASRADLEEERRLFYVAITRAKEKLSMSYALTRYRFGRLKNCEPSRFIEEVDPKYIQVDKKFSISSPILPGRNFFVSNLMKKTNSQNLRKGKTISDYSPQSDFTPSDTSKLNVGMKVEHPKFGFGSVVAMDEYGVGRKAKVNFNNFGEKTLLLSFAKLKIHE